MRAARRALSSETSNGVLEGVQASMQNLTRQLRGNLRLRDIASAEVRGINAELRQVNTALITQRFEQSLGRIRESVGAIFATIGMGQQALGKPIKASIDFEDSFASVKKVLDDATDPEKLKAGVLKMSVALGSSTKDLNAILESAGQMGIKGDKNLLKFTQTVQKMSVAFDMSADEAGKSMAQIQSVLNLSMDEMVSLGDTINNVSNNTTAKAADIIDMLKRLGGTGKDFFAAGKNFGFTAKQITGLGSAMLDLGMTPDVASTALSAMMNKLQAGGKPFKKWFDEMGLDFDEWSEQRAKAPQKALKEFFKNINALEDKDKTNALKDMFGLEHLGKIKTLTGALDKFDHAMKLATADSKGSMDAEFAAKASTTAHQLKRLGAQLEVLYINIGDAVLPIINKIIQGFTSLITPIANFVKEHRGLTKGLVIGAAAFLGFKMAVIGLSILGPLTSIVFTPLLRAFTLLRFSIFGNVSALIAHRIATILSATAGFALRAPLLLLGGAYRLLTGQISLTSVATRVFALTSMLCANVFSGAMKLMRLALIGSGIGFLIVGIGVAIYGIVAHWESVKGWILAFLEGLKERLKGFVEGVKLIWGAIVEGLSPVFGALKALLMGWFNVWLWVFGVFQSVLGGVLGFFGISMQSLGGVFVGLKEMVINAWQAILDFIDPVIAFLQKVYNWYKSLFSGVLGKVAGALGFKGVQIEKEKVKEIEKTDLSPPSLKDQAKSDLPALGVGDLTPQNALAAVPRVDYAKLGGQTALSAASKTDNRKINSENTQTFNIYTQSDPNAIVGAIKQAGIGAYSYDDDQDE